MSKKATSHLSNSFYATLLNQKEAIETKFRRMTPNPFYS